MKKSVFAFGLFLGLTSSASAQQTWQVSAFGQSTDLNFSSLIKAEKIGLNRVWISGQADYLSPEDNYALPTDFFIESRGGKLSNSHDGMTVFYTQIPISSTFVLEADVTLWQLGPEVDGKTPAAQEAAGLFVRDVIGTPRQEPQSNGYEEFPNASNLLMNGLITQNKKNDDLVQLTAIVRENVKQPWGNEKVTINKTALVKNINYVKQKNIHLAIERTQDQFILKMFDANQQEVKSWSMKDYSGFMNQQEADFMYVGFFAARNAKIEIKNASFKFTDSKVDYKKLEAKEIAVKTIKPELLIASPAQFVTSEAILQFLPNQDGEIKLIESQITKNVKAGQLVQLPVSLNEGKNTFTLDYKTAQKMVQQTVKVDYVKTQLADTKSIYVAANGKANATGTEQDPTDLKTAMQFVAPNGVINLADGHYDGIDLPRTLSGLPNAPKTLIATNKHQALFVNKTFNLDADYWIIKHVVFDGNVANKDSRENKPAYLRISGNHNVIEQVIARNNDDTGIAISAKSKDRLFWPSYNHIINSDSYNNLDLSGINADGFAAKLGVGAGNKFTGCISHHNADDGWDLFNKIEDGPNEPVTIENSISYANGLPFSKPNIAKGSIGNGFKLGGEGQPVNHKIINSIAFNNNMDGFTDNFNTGSLTVENNIALNNARYNYILRSNPYSFLKSTIVFENNYSIRNSWQNAPQDYFGTQVKAKNNVETTTKALWNVDNIDIQTIERDENGAIIYPEYFKKLNPAL